MIRRVMACAVAVSSLLLGGCLGGSGDLSIPRIEFSNGGTSSVSPQFAAIGGGVPDGVQATFLGDVVLLRGNHFRPTMKVFFGLNMQLARRPDSIMTLPRHRLPDTPFVYTDPVTGQETVLEIEVPFEFVKQNELRITVPPAVACQAAFTDPIVRLFGDDGSSDPEDGVFHVVGPRSIALTPRQGADIGGYSVIVHGDFFSPYTQVAFRYVDPVTKATVTVGDTPQTDIPELFVDRHTLVVPNWPGVVPNATLGLAQKLVVDLLLFENIDAIAGNAGLEPDLGGDAPCRALEPESPEAPIQRSGVRNSEKASAFTFLPTGVTDYPSIASVTPESGVEVGGNTVVLHGDQFDAFTADLSDPADPGVGIECPPGSGTFVPPLEATLVDRQTLVIKMPPCSVDVPQLVDLCLRNKFSIDHPGGAPATGPGGDCVLFEDRYTYLPVPPIAPPVLRAIYPADATSGKGTAHDFGLERLIVTGDWFDADTALPGGFEFLLPDPQGGDPIVVQAQRVILHNRNLIEVFTPRLPPEFYPLTQDLIAGVRLRNALARDPKLQADPSLEDVIGHADFMGAVVFRATPDAGVPPVLTSLVETGGPVAGGNQVMVFGAGFDTSTEVLFGGTPATDVQFVHAGLLVATAPAAAGPGPVAVTVVDDGESSASLDYTYSDAIAKSCPALGYLDPASGSSTGGYSILAYGSNLTPTTRVAFGLGDGNFAVEIFFVAPNLLRVVVPEAFPEQIGATVGVAATDPLGGCDEAVRTVDFTFTAAQANPPEILFVDTTVEAPPTPTTLPALNVTGGDRMLVVGKFFDQQTTFDVEKPQGSAQTSDTTQVTVLTPNLAVMTAPASPDGKPGVADLQAHNAFGDSNEFAVEYVQPGPPAILDVRNLDDGTTTAPIDARDRILIFGDNFFEPLTVRLTGCDLGDPSARTTVTFKTPDVTLVEDHLIGVNIPADTFCEGPLSIEVETDYGSASYEDDQGRPIFLLIGPQPPVVEGVFPTRFNSNGGQDAILFGRFFTETTKFSVRSDLMAPGLFTHVLSTRYVSGTVAIVTMPALPGGMPPAGVGGDARAEELDAILRAKIAGDPFTVSTGLFTVVNDEAPILLGVFPDHGSIDGGEQVLLLGANFLTAIGESNVSGIRIVDPVLGDLGAYTAAPPGTLPLDSLDPADRGRYVILNDHEILLLTNPRPPIAPEGSAAPADVFVDSVHGNSTLAGGYTYLDTPAVRTPHLLGITPNETRRNGTTSHLISGGFLTEADRIVFTRPGDGATYTIPLSGGAFDEVNDSFLVFVMPDLSATFAAGDLLDLHAEKDVGGSPLVSNTLHAALRVSFAGPPVITPALSPAMGTAFGGTVVELTGSFFTPNSQVLFGTLPARYVVFDSPTRLLAIAPSLPVDLPPPGTDLANLGSAGETVDVAVFTQGGWAVLEGAYTFEPEAPAVSDCSPEELAEGDSALITVHGARFVPGMTTVTPSEGTVSGLEVLDFTTLRFTYKAPTRPAGTKGPLAVSLTIATNQGTAAATCDLTVHLDPFLTSVVTTYTPNDKAAPTTGFAGGALVKGTLTGGNLLAGGGFGIRMSGTAPDVVLVEAPTLTAPGQYRVVDDETIEFTVPNIFNDNVPTLLDGNPNVGPVDAGYESPFGRLASLDKAYAYVATLLDFDDYSFTIEPADTEIPLPNKVTVGDINADGVPDAVVLSRNSGSKLAYVFIADTFGPGVDVNGDGKTPDFAGTFTQHAITESGLWVDGYINGRGGVPRLANLDDDDPLEIILPVTGGGSGARTRLLILDVDADGTLGARYTIIPTSLTSGAGSVSGIAVGNFDSSDDGTDIAIIAGGNSDANRKIVLFASTATAFSFTDTTTDIPDPLDDLRPGYLAAGDFDGDGDDDLVWGYLEKYPSVARATFPIVFAEVDASTGTILSQKKLENLTGGGVRDIAVFDADGDGTQDAMVLIEDEAKGSLLGGATRPGGFVVVLDPLKLKAHAYLETGFVLHGSPPFNGDGRGIAGADFNGDGITDLVLGDSTGEFVVYLGDGKGGFTDAGRSWTLLAIPQTFESRVHGLDAGDLNGDGLAEVFLGDLGQAPTALSVWLNQSR